MSVNGTGKRRILVLSINYIPEVTGFGPHVAMFTSHLVRCGYSVAVCTGFPFAPRWKRWPKSDHRIFARENMDGVSVLRHAHYIPSKPGRLIARLLMETSFCIMTLPALLIFGLDADLLVYVGAQPSLAMLLRCLSFVLRVPYAVMINDLAAGAAADVGIVKSPLLNRILEKFEFASYSGAVGATVLCEAFKTALVAHGFPQQRATVVRSPIDIELIHPMTGGDCFRRKLGIGADAFIVLFAGSMGLKQGMLNIVEAARLLRSRDSIVVWVLVGEGEARGQVEESVANLELCSVVKIHNFVADKDMSDMFAASNLLLLNQLTTVKDTVIPSKLLTYMAAGKPVVAAVNLASQGAALLRQSGGGWLVDPGNPSALADAVESCSRDPDSLRRAGNANRIFAERYLDRRQVTRDLEEFICEILKSGAVQQI